MHLSCPWFGVNICAFAAGINSAFGGVPPLNWLKLGHPIRAYNEIEGFEKSKETSSPCFCIEPMEVDFALL